MSRARPRARLRSERCTASWHPPRERVRPLPPCLGGGTTAERREGACWGPRTCVGRGVPGFGCPDLPPRPPPAARNLPGARTCGTPGRRAPGHVTSRATGRRGSWGSGPPPHPAAAAPTPPRATHPGIRGLPGRSQRKKGRRQRRPQKPQPPQSDHHPTRHLAAHAAFVRSRQFRVPGGGAWMAPPRADLPRPLVS